MRDVPLIPELPPGRVVRLPGRGTTFIRELAGPPGAPAVVLVHGWVATADLTWFRHFASLGSQYRVVALDLRGHGRGIRGERFSLARCADDVAALIADCRLDRPILVGYSMGGPVAMLAARRHPDLVGGLVLCATASWFPVTRRQRAVFESLGALLRMAPHSLRSPLFLRLLIARRDLAGNPLKPWVSAEVERHALRDILAAGSELARFDARPWLGSVRQPVAVVVTTDDTLVPPATQYALADHFPGATRHEIAGDHAAVVSRAGVFTGVLLGALQSVAQRQAGPAAHGAA